MSVNITTQYYSSVHYKMHCAEIFENQHYQCTMTEDSFFLQEIQYERDDTY